MGRKNQQRNVELLRIQALPVSEQSMLTERLAMVGRDDDQCVLEHPASVELVDESPDLGIEVADAVIIGVSGEHGVSLGYILLGSLVPPSQESKVGLVFR